MKYINKSFIIFLWCFALFFFNFDVEKHIYGFLLSLIITCFLVLIKNYSIQFAFYLFYYALCILVPSAVIFSPILSLRLHKITLLYHIIFMLFPIYLKFEVLSFQLIIFTYLLHLLVYLIDTYEQNLHKLQEQYISLQDNSNEYMNLLSVKNQTLLENQDYEINIAKLNERNRISKELHDSIGHLLSRSLLMIGALLTLSKEQDVYKGLSTLKDSLSDGMTNVRNSIHDMHDDSIDLYASLNLLVSEFTFCNIAFEYDIKSTFHSRLKLSIQAIVKEGLANIIRHSNASKVELIVREHPAMYQIILSDNGRVDSVLQIKLNRVLHGQLSSDGMGLQNMIDRVKSFHGIIHLNFDEGFKIFISIPKT